MNILFLCNTFPGQYRHVAPFVAEQDGVRVMVATQQTNPRESGFREVRYAPYREVSPGIQPMLAPAEQAVLQGHAAYGQLYRICLEGYRPDLICAQGGAGPAHFMKDLWPGAKLLVMHDWFYRGRGGHADFLGPITDDQAGRLRMRNVPTLIDLAAQDWGTVATCFQLKQFPSPLQTGLSVIHEGIDTAYFCPGHEAIRFKDRLFLADQEIITYANPGMEPYRGFPQFMASVARLQRRRPQLQVIIAGEDKVAYGEPRRDGMTWREEALATLELDRSRLHFTGPVAADGLRALFRISRAHVYLTVPFVLSWSLMEAMATGTPIVASRTGPVEELIRHEREGLLVDFFDVEAQVAAIERVLDDAALRQRLGKAARLRMVEEYDQGLMARRHWELMLAVVRGELDARNEVMTLSELAFE